MLWCKWSGWTNYFEHKWSPWTTYSRIIYAVTGLKAIIAMLGFTLCPVVVQAILYLQPLFMLLIYKLI